MGALGYIYYLNFTQNKTDDTVEPVVTVVDNNNYLSIIEWGIKGIYNGKHPISYSISTYNGWLSFKSVDFVISSISTPVGMMKRLGANDPVDAASTPPGIEDNTPASVAFAQDSITSRGGHKKIGEYYYVLTTSWDSAAPGSTAKELEDSIFLDINEWFQSLKVE